MSIAEVPFSAAVLHTLGVEDPVHAVVFRVLQFTVRGVGEFIGAVVSGFGVCNVHVSVHGVGESPAFPESVKLAIVGCGVVELAVVVNTVSSARTAPAAVPCARTVTLCPEIKMVEVTAALFENVGFGTALFKL